MPEQNAGRTAEIVPTPDFAALGRQTVFGAATWQRAWEAVRPEPRLWNIVVTMADGGGTSPVTAANMLVKALREPLFRPGSTAGGDPS